MHGRRTFESHVRSDSSSRAACFAAFPGGWAILAAAVLLIGSAHQALGSYHELGYGEPYELEGKRIVFTTWYWVKPGQFDYVNDEGKSVFARRDVKALPGDPHVHWKQIDIPHGVRLVGEPPVKGEFPIRPEYPWEAHGIQITSVYQLDDGKIMAWGVCKPGGNCYFESTDGLTWIRPKLGLVEFNGSKDNNLGGPGSFRGMYDPTAPPQERFKQLNNEEWTVEDFERHWKGKRPYQRMAIEINPKVVQAVWGFTSPDGLNWRRSELPLSVETCDGGQYLYYDRKLKKYVMFIRSYMIGPRAEGFAPQPKSDDWKEDYYKATIRFGIGRSESADFRYFPLADPIIETGNDIPPTDTFQFCLYTTIPKAPDHHLMFPTRWQRDQDRCVIDLYTSYNGKTWNRVLAPVVDTSNWGQWDGGSVWALNGGLVELGNGDWILPYRGDLLTKSYPRGHLTQRWGAAIWPQGRLMAIEAQEQGSFATVAIVAPGTRLRINAVTRPTGQILAEAASLHGQTIPGRSFDQCIPINGHQYRKLVTWKAADDLGVKPGEPVMLRFRMFQARIYCLDFE
jgi:hypothetical protein